METSDISFIISVIGLAIVFTITDPRLIKWLLNVGAPRQTGISSEKRSPRRKNA